MALPTSDLDPRRILIVLHGSIGDVTRALPLAAILRRGFPQAFLAWSVEPACLPLLRGNRAIDEVLLFDRRAWWNSTGEFLARVRAGHFDMVLDLQRIFKSGFIGWWSGARRRIGFHRRDSKEFNWMFNNLHIGEYGEEIPKLEHYLKFADYLGLDRGNVQWDFALTPEEQTSVDRHLDKTRRPFAALFVGTRWQSKQWFPSQMSRCAEQLARNHDLDTVLLGGNEDRQLAKEVESFSETKLANLVGQTALREAIGVIQRAKIAIGPDTGLMHIAAAVRTPVISLWGATRPERTGPLGFGELALQGKAPCVPCQRRTCSIGRVCLQSITQEEIGAKIRAALAGQAGASLHHAG
jgi:heptosyltransferase-1